MKILACAATLAFLAACGGSGTDMTPVVPTSLGAPTFEQFRSDVIEVQAGLDRIRGYQPTTVANLPTPGTSTFTGGATIIAKQGKAQYYLIGKSSLTVNFANERVIGTATGFRGYNSANRGILAPGKLTYSGGQIDTATNPVELSLSYQGSLDAGGDTIAMQGDAVGGFWGNRTSGAIRTRGITAVSGTVGSAVDQAGAPNMTATVNGKTAIVDFIITGEN
ncbi:hypothetical protein ACOI1H_03755 [Loktanella sp. DJP18]|uniref:hypothetical protein n=1 Tax=Loktanella sp. DJP18 TaxID=3409788 RepID=UPI003BB796E9